MKIDTLICCIVILILPLANSCKESYVKVDKAQPIDSIRLFAPKDEMYCIRMVNDSLMASSGPSGTTLKFYVLVNNKEYKLKKSIPLQIGKGILARMNMDSAILVGEKSLLIYLLKDGKYHRYFTNETKPFIKDFFSFKHGVTSLPILRNDTFFVNYYPVNSTIYYEGVKEKAISIYRIRDTSLVKIKDVVTKPANLINNEDLRSFFCTAGNNLVLTFAPCDTLYTLDLHTFEEHRIRIGNAFYKKSDSFDHSRYMDQEYTTNYYLNNFAYHGILYNDKTEHYVLFFDAPYINNDKKYPNDLYALVLDKNFKALKYYLLGNEYSNSSSFINIKNKGIALKLANTPDHDSVQSYHIYNF